MFNDNTYTEMFVGRYTMTPQIIPAMLKRDEDEYTVVKKGKNKNEDITFIMYRDKIETIYLIRDGYDYSFRHGPDMVTNALEFHVIYDKDTGKSTGILYYDTYDMNYTRRTPARVHIPYDRKPEQAHEGYKCTNLRRHKVEFFPPEINSINALSKCLKNRVDGYLLYSRLISIIELEGLKQKLREQFGLDQNTEIFVNTFDLRGNIQLDGISYEEAVNEYFFGAASFNNRFFLFREFFYDGLELLEDERLELLECRPTREIRTREDFDNFTDDCEDIYPNMNEGGDFMFEEGIRETAAAFIDDPGLFIQAEEKAVIKTDVKYKKTLSKENREFPDPVMDNLICKKLESLALQHYKHFTRRDIGFEYECVDGLKIQHNIQDKQRIGLINRRLQFFKRQQLERRLNCIQNAGNNMAFQDDERSLD